VPGAAAFQPPALHPGAWAAEYASRHAPPPLAAAWAAQFARAPAGAWAAEFSAPGAAWAAEFQAGGAGPSWASEYASRGRDPTPAERKAARGPRRDDPLDDPSAPTWVASFNATLGGATANGDAPAVIAAEAAGLLALAASNPACRLADPVAAAASAASSGRPGDAALAWEAAVRRAPAEGGRWHALGVARGLVGDAAGAVAALRVASAPLDAPPRAVVDLAAAALAAGGTGNASLATECVSRWCVAARAAPPGTPALALDAALTPLAASGGAAGRDAAMALGVLRGVRGAHVAAADAFAAAAAAAPGDPAPLLALGRSLLAAGRVEHAEAAARAALRACPATPAAWGLIGRARARADAPADPLAPARAHARAAALAPGVGVAWDELALALTAAGRPDWADAAAARVPVRELLMQGE